MISRGRTSGVSGIAKRLPDLNKAIALKTAVTSIHNTRNQRKAAPAPDAPCAQPPSVPAGTFPATILRRPTDAFKRVPLPSRLPVWQKPASRNARSLADIKVAFEPEVADLSARRPSPTCIGPHLSIQHRGQTL